MPAARGRSIEIAIVMAPLWRSAVAASAVVAGVVLLLTAETDLTYDTYFTPIICHYAWSSLLMPLSADLAYRYYDRIGVPEDAELPAIKKAYRTAPTPHHRLCLGIHHTAI